jgi:ubiquitin-protein ligase
MPDSLEVRNVLFKEEWNPVLTLTQIILALELMVCVPEENPHKSP